MIQSFKEYLNEQELIESILDSFPDTTSSEKEIISALKITNKELNDFLNSFFESSDLKTVAKKFPKVFIGKNAYKIATKISKNAEKLFGRGYDAKLDSLHCNRFSLGSIVTNEGSKEAVIFLNGKLSDSNFEKYKQYLVSSKDLYTNKSFLDAVKKNGEVVLDQDGKCKFKVINDDDEYYGACIDIRDDDSRLISTATQMDWVASTIDSVVDLALKERGVNLLKRANNYVISKNL